MTSCGISLLAGVLQYARKCMEMACPLTRGRKKPLANDSITIGEERVYPVIK